MLSILPKILFAFTCTSHRKKNLDKLNYQGTTVISTIALTFSFFSASSVNAANFTFFQEDWQLGGNLSGSFTGDDFNNNGKIETSELSAFNAIFSGNVRDRKAPYYPALPTNPNHQIVPLSIQTFHSLPLPKADVEEDLVEPLILDFKYSLLNSQLTFRSTKITCIVPILGGCNYPKEISSITVSDTGGNITFDLYRNFLFGTTSLSTPTVKPLQQTVPEPSTLGAVLLGGLGFLLRKKVISSRTTAPIKKV